MWSCVWRSSLHCCGLLWSYSEVCVSVHRVHRKRTGFDNCCLSQSSRRGARCARTPSLRLTDMLYRLISAVYVVMFVTVFSTFLRSSLIIFWSLCECLLSAYWVPIECLLSAYWVPIECLLSALYIIIFVRDFSLFFKRSSSVCAHFYLFFKQSSPIH